MELSAKQLNDFFTHWQHVAIKKDSDDTTPFQLTSINDFSLFISQFKALQALHSNNLKDNSDILKFEQFFYDWQAIPPEKIAESSSQTEITFSLLQATSFFTDFTQCYQKHKTNGYAINILDVCGIKYDEVKHCQVLKWLLDPTESHGLNESLFRFLVNHFGWEWLGNIDDNYSIKTEISYDTKNQSNNNSQFEGSNSINSRVDIQIETKQCFAIMEVKINAAETGDQIVRYCRIAERYASDNKKFSWKVIYLTKDGSKPINYQKSDKQDFERYLQNDVICLKWSDIAYAIDKFIISTATINPFMQLLLPQYSQYIYRNF